MCGIGGVFLTKNKLISESHEKSLTDMKVFMHDRGPDGSGILCDKQVGLVHTRLSIVDVASRSNQPMQSQHWILSFNGEIVNYKSLRSQLESQYTFQTESDTEVLLFALEAFGIETALKKSAGMFSFLAYNKSTGFFYAARDPMGIKPLFYCQQDDEFWFASTPAAIKTALPSRAWQQHKPAIASFFILGAPFTKTSTTEGIQQLAPASYLAISPQGDFEFKRYWSPEFQSHFSMDDLINVVMEYQNADVKSALFLSGGVDSSFLATLIPHLDFLHLNSLEIPYAQKVAKHFNKPLIVVKPDVDNYFKGIKKVCKTFGEPLMSCGIPYSVSFAARQNGYKMAISANGADELFLGYPRTPLDFSIKKLNKSDFNANQWLSNQIAHIFRHKHHFSIEEYDAYFPSFMELSMDIIKNCYLSNFDASANYRWIELMTYVLNDLNPTLDAASMANSLEVRVPFLDHRIVQGVLSWPTERLYETSLGRKAPLKRHLLPIFGEKFIHRPKLGFSIDEVVLSKINKQMDYDFATLTASKFIQLNTQHAHSAAYGRDAILLKPICSVFKIWKEVVSANSV